MIDGRITKCKHLVKLKSGKTLCRVYKTHLGRVLHDNKDGTVQVCKLRKDGNYDYEGCPYNTDKPMFGKQ